MRHNNRTASPPLWGARVTLVVTRLLRLREGRNVKRVESW
ncbi:unnamed protein product [Brassica rapa subsp. trilocularis]